MNFNHKNCTLYLADISEKHARYSPPPIATSAMNWITLMDTPQIIPGVLNVQLKSRIINDPYD
jgi:hypothetical protein